MRTIYQRIRDAYPNATFACERDPEVGGDYCVGGACSLWAGDHQYIPAIYRAGWPVAEELAFVLGNLNPQLGRTLAESFAMNIIDLNDSGKVREAWDELESALAIGDGPN